MAAHEDSFRPPVQDLNNEESFEAELAKFLKQNPDRKAQVFENLRHLMVMHNAGAGAPPRGGKLEAITRALQAATSEGFTWVRFVFVYLLTTLSDVIKREGEIPKEQRDKFDGMKRNLENVKMKLKKVEQDVGNLNETIKRAVEADYKISNTENKKLEIGLVTAKCDMYSCEDDVTCVREAYSHLQLEVKEATTFARNLLIVGMILIMAVGFAAVFLYHWDGPPKVYNSRYRDNDDVDDDINTKGMKTCIALAGFLLVAVGAFGKQSYLNNKKLLTECEEFMHNDLQKAERLTKGLKCDVEVRLPLSKKQLDIDQVSLYASLRRPHWE